MNKPAIKFTPAEVKKPVINQKGIPFNKSVLATPQTIVKPTKNANKIVNRPKSPGNFFKDDLAPTKVRSDFRKKASGLTPVNYLNYFSKSI